MTTPSLNNTITEFMEQCLDAVLHRYAVARAAKANGAHTSQAKIAKEMRQQLNKGKRND